MGKTTPITRTRINWELFRWRMKTSQLKELAGKLKLDISGCRNKRELAKKVADCYGISEYRR